MRNLPLRAEGDYPVVQLANPAEIETAPKSDARYSPDTLAHRIQRLRDRLQEQEWDALLVTNPNNRLYLSGFTGHDAPPLDSAGFLLVTRRDLCLVTDGRYGIQANRELHPDLGVSVQVHQSSLLPTTIDQIKARGVRTLGFETAHILHTWWAQLVE